MPARASTAKKSREADKDVLHNPVKDSKVRKRPMSKPQVNRLANWSWTHELPTEEQRVKNGRLPGRTLVNWSKPFILEKALLHLLYECDVQGIELPLDHVAHRLWPGATGEALRQRCERLRKEFVAAGHLVPPKIRRGQEVSPLVRGVVRANQEDPTDLKTTRDVLFTEPFVETPTYDDSAFTLAHNKSCRKKGDTPGVNQKLRHRFLNRMNANIDANGDEDDNFEDVGSDLERGIPPQHQPSRLSHGKAAIVQQSSEFENDMAFGTQYQLEDNAYIGTTDIGDAEFMPEDFADFADGEFDSSPDLVTQLDQRYYADPFFTPIQRSATGSNAAFIPPASNSTGPISPTEMIWSQPSMNHNDQAIFPSINQAPPADYLDRILLAQQSTQALLQHMPQNAGDKEHQRSNGAAHSTSDETDQNEANKAGTNDPEPFTSYGRFLNIPDVEYDDLFPDLGI
ncbi:hypothetical protein JX265_003151 [Neoarthrinium moseri]|uniref:Uncharacterized protein n=1 Tax=Neoarthrinium moseri TaxID=1658444 RepID=A0A9P9WTR7_9PEZI|nr:hypothetical protein JX265_003151 [Neoarthrinium moseri]